MIISFYIYDVYVYIYIHRCIHCIQRYREIHHESLSLSICINTHVTYRHIQLIHHMYNLSIFLDLRLSTRGIYPIEMVVTWGYSGISTYMIICMHIHINIFTCSQNEVMGCRFKAQYRCRLVGSWYSMC